MAINPVLQTVMNMAGESFAVIRDSEVVAQVRGMKNRDPNTGKEYIALFPGTDVTRGDRLKAQNTEEEFLIVATEHEYVEGQLFQDRAYHGSMEEFPPIQSDASQVPIVSIPENKLPYYMDYIKCLIKIKIPEPEQELEALVTQLEKGLSTGTISQGSLTDYKELLEEKDWLSSAVGTVLLSWITSRT
jgi:hypothetical protein